MRHFVSNRQAPAVRARLMGRPFKGAPNKAAFYGDPVELPADSGAIAVQDPTAADQIVEEAVVNSPSPAVQEERLAAYDAMSPTERAEVTISPVLSLDNANVILKPITRDVASANVDFNLQQALNNFPFEGKVKTQPGRGIDPSTGLPYDTVIKFSKEDILEVTGSEYGIATVPFFRFNISASTLNSRAGGNYEIIVRGTAVNGKIIETPGFVFQRRSATEMVVGVFIPFDVIASRTLPQLLRFGQEGEGIEALPDFEVRVKGMMETEVLSVTVPGYATSELRDVARVYNLVSGLRVF